MEDNTIKEINALFSDNCNLLPGYNARFLIKTTTGDWWYPDNSPSETNTNLLDCCSFTIEQQTFHYNLTPAAKAKHTTAGNYIYAGIPVLLFDGQVNGVVFIAGYRKGLQHRKPAKIYQIGKTYLPININPHNHFINPKQTKISPT